MSNEITYAECISSLVPGSSWSISGNDYLTLIWDDDSYVKPTEQEILTKKTELVNEYPIQMMREQRNFLLMESDKYSLPDYPHYSEGKKQEWLTYRQDLRNMTSSQSPSINLNGELINVTWPTIP
tara:strand:+ start:538 stop:912 length:375 start_codon:yes stop_codon:yes gene_type:complete